MHDGEPQLEAAGLDAELQSVATNAISVIAPSLTCSIIEPTTTDR